MKRVDDEMAKLRFWAEHPQVMAMPRIINLPRFAKQSFRSHQEMNEWKRALLRELARAGGAKWKTTCDD